MPNTSSRALLIASSDPDLSGGLEAALEALGESRSPRTVGFEETRSVAEELALARIPLIVLVHVEDRNCLGSGVIAELKKDPSLQRIPVLAMGHRLPQALVDWTYEVGAVACIPAPETEEEFHGLATVMQKHWLKLVRIPNTGG